MVSITSLKPYFEELMKLKYSEISVSLNETSSKNLTAFNHTVAKLFENCLSDSESSASSGLACLHSLNQLSRVHTPSPKMVFGLWESLNKSVMMC
jgi:hypothetical protein